MTRDYIFYPVPVPVPVPPETFRRWRQSNQKEPPRDAHVASNTMVLMQPRQLVQQAQLVWPVAATGSMSMSKSGQFFRMAQMVQTTQYTQAMPQPMKNEFD